jgi:hypothetical protein
VPISKGNFYEHPVDGLIRITNGYYLDPVYGRVSNHFYWTVLSTGKTHNGYGGDWPQIKPIEQSATFGDGTTYRFV